MTAEEKAAMDSVNRHFTFRERTAFLVGYRTALSRERLRERGMLDRLGWKEADIQAFLSRQPERTASGVPVETP